MSHGPEHSEPHGHAKVIGPDEDGFDWPLVEKGHYAHHPVTHDSTHRYPDGHYYTIKQGPDDDIGSPGSRIYNESHVKDPLEYGLYREREGRFDGFVRPAPSSDEFAHATGQPNNEHDEPKTLLTEGLWVADTDGGVYKDSNEKRDIDARATPIIAAYEARDRALADGLSIEEAQAIGAEVYNVHFGMKGVPIPEEHVDRPALGASAQGQSYDLPGGPSTEREQPPASHSRERRFGRAATDSANGPRPRGSEAQHQEAAEFIHDMRIQFPNSAWLRDISPENMNALINEVRALRQEMINNDVLQKTVQDGRIYRKYRMKLESTENPDEVDKQKHGVLWDIMGHKLKDDGRELRNGQRPTGDIPI